MYVSSKYQICPGLKILKRVKLTRTSQSFPTVYCEIVALKVERVEVLWSCFMSHVWQLEHWKYAWSKETYTIIAQLYDSTKYEWWDHREHTAVCETRVKYAL